jgi:hypothetical protein
LTLLIHDSLRNGCFEKTTSTVAETGRIQGTQSGRVESSRGTTIVAVNNNGGNRQPEHQPCGSSGFRRTPRNGPSLAACVIARSTDQTQTRSTILFPAQVGRKGITVPNKLFVFIFYPHKLLFTTYSHQLPLPHTYRVRETSPPLDLLSPFTTVLHPLQDGNRSDSHPSDPQELRGSLHLRP